MQHREADMAEIRDLGPLDYILLNIWFKVDIVISEWWVNCPPHGLLVAPSKLGLECLGSFACADSAHARSGGERKGFLLEFHHIQSLTYDHNNHAC